MDFNKLLEQAQAMQNSLTNVQNEVNAMIFEGKSGNEVIVKMNGANEVQEVIISDDVMGIENKEMLQDMILIAVNDAVAKADEARNAKVSSVTGGLNIPGL